MGKKPAEKKATQKDLSTKGIYKEKANRVKIIRKVMLDHIQKNKPKNSFVMHDMQALIDRIEIWRHHMPRVEVFYAVKAMISDPVVKQCVAMGTGFDVSSVHEMEQVLKNGAKPNDLIFANPVKQDNQILATKKLKVKKLAFDSIQELKKIHKLYPKAECILRIATQTTDALKFGATMKNVDEILQTAKKLNVHVKGVAFHHTGSGGVSFEGYQASLSDARTIFDKAEKMGLKKMDFLDIGGGFTLICPEKGKNFTDVAKLIQDMVEKVFPEKSIRIVGEPGRYIAESVQYVVSQVIGQKVLGDDYHHYYVNNGIYGTYAIRVFGESCDVEPVDQKILKRKHAKTTWWGQTCDSCDFISKDQQHPIYKTGEWVFTKDWGAYNNAMGCDFNGFAQPDEFFHYSK